MDTIDKIIDTLKKTLNDEIFKLNNENKHLKEEVQILKNTLREKEEDYRRIAAVLKAQNTQWKGLISKLVANRQLKNKKPSIDSKEAAHIDTDTETERIETDIEVEIDTESEPFVEYDDSTQLPPEVQRNYEMTQTQTQSPPKETQSHLDTLISLISDSENEEKENVTPKAAAFEEKSFEYDNRPKKRKSHSRGCPCCDKYYQATRPSTTTTPKAATSFLAAPKTPPGFWDTSFTPRE